VLCAFWSGCGGNDQQPGKSVEVLEAYSPAASAGVRQGEAFLKLVNHSHEPERLIAVESDVAGEILMVQASRDPGNTGTVPLPAGFQIAAGATLDLGPGRSHLVLSGLSRPLLPGETYSMQLQFKNSETLDVRVEVRP